MNPEGLELYKPAIEALLDVTIDKTIETVQNAAEKAKKQLLIKTRKAFKQYLETAIEKYNEIKTLFNTAEPVLLDSLYVDLDLSIGRKIISGNIDKVLGYGKQLIITGLAGCGKSTLLKYLFLQTIKSRKKIPFFIELKRIEDPEKPFIENLLILFNEMNLGLSLDDFLLLLRQGEYILLFDGLDEVAPALFDYVEQGIIGLRDKYYKSLFIVTSRPNEVFKSWQNFSEAYVVPLSMDKAIMLLNNINYEPEIKERFIEDVKASLFLKHESFLSNPLLLSIMLITYGQYADIPDKLTLFYRQAFEALFNKHDATKQGFKRTRFTQLPIDDFQKIISALSIQSYIEHKINFSHQEVINYLAISKKLVDVQDYDEEAILKDLLQSLCIIVRDGLEYKFTHRSFQEYFAAIFISTCAKDDRKRIIKNINGKYTYENIFYLLFEIDRTIIEDDFLLEEINKYKRIYGKYDNPELSFFMTLFSKIAFDTYGHAVKQYVDNIGHHDLFQFFQNTYGKSYTNELTELYSNAQKTIGKIMDYQKKAGKKKKTDIDILSGEMVGDQEYLPLLMEYIKPELFLTGKMFELPEKVKEERKNKKDVLGGLLSK